jgi:hypothetical protein
MLNAQFLKERNNYREKKQREKKRKERKETEKRERKRCGKRLICTKKEAN